VQGPHICQDRVRAGVSESDPGVRQPDRSDDAELKGLGHSAMANLYGISSLQEARAHVRIRAIWFTRFNQGSASPSTFSVRLEE
jgi:hypothetical protein